MRIEGINQTGGGAPRRCGGTLGQRHERAVVIIAAARASGKHVHADRITRIIGLGLGASSGKARADRYDNEERYTHVNLPQTTGGTAETAAEPM